MDSLTPLEMALLPEHARADVDRWHQAFMAITPPITKALQDIAARLGRSYATAVRRYYAWKQFGARGLLKASDSSDSGVMRTHVLGRETFDYYHTLCLQNGRKCKPAYRKLTREFFAGQPIPGLPPGTPRTHLPPGWSYRAFQRHAPTPFELRAARIGLKSAADCRPLVFTSRTGLHVGQFVMFDDVWHDFEVFVLGRRERCRLLQLHAHDLFSACQFARGLKPRVTQHDDTSTNLSERDMVFLLAHVLGRYGHHPDGSTLVLEAGTATIRGPVADLLKQLSSGKIRCHVGEVRSERAFAGQYLGRGKGNFRLKASLESMHNLLHNETADLIEFPGQTGSNSRINLPEELHGRQRETDQLLAAMRALPDRVTQQLRLGLLEVSQAIWAVEEVCERINRRTDHALEGWVEAGLTTVDYLVPGVGTIPGAKLLDLDEPRRQAILAVAEPRGRRLSPREVFDAGSRSLVRWRTEQLALLLWHARRDEPVAVGKDHLITFRDSTVSTEPLRFLAHTFQPGDKFDAVVNPLDPSQLYIYGADGRWIGALDHWGRIQRDDLDAIARRQGRAEAIKAGLLKPVRDTALSLAKTDRAEHNAQVLQEHLGRLGQANDRAREALMDV